jgi:hypothetical protein
MLGPMQRLVRPVRAGVVTCAVALTCAGCGVGRGDVSGKVTRNNKPVVFGTVLIVGTDGLPRIGPILEDGTYEVKGVRAGPVRIAVSSPDPTTPLFNKDDERRGRPHPPEDEKRLAALKPKWFPLPSKYNDVTTSELTLEVHRGQNPYDIDLK